MSLITWNPNDKGNNVILSNENLTAQVPNYNNSVRATVGKMSGKWYWELQFTELRLANVGISNKSLPAQSSNILTISPNYRGYYSNGGWKFPEQKSYGNSYGVNDVIGIALDLDNFTLSFYKNGINQGVSHTNLEVLEEVFPTIAGDASGNTCTANFGATPFQYEIPEGYLPYDYENADWVNTNKYLLKKDNKILTIESDALVETILQEPLTKLDFEELGFNGLDLLLDKDLSNMELLINPSTEAVMPTINVKVTPGPQLIIPTGDIVLRMLDKIYNFTIYSNKNSAGDIKIIFSVDEGINWQTYNPDTGEFEEIDITKIKEVKEKGIDPDTFNSIGQKWNQAILNNKIRFGYYLEVEDINDIAELDKLEIEMDIHGRWKKARHGQDYHYKYDNEHLYVSFFKDGSYKINYQG